MISTLFKGSSVRIIPKLDIKGPNLVKGVHLEGLRVLGKPWDFAKFYYEQGADELIYMDAVASLYNRNNLLHIVEKTSKEIFIPITVGGGIRTISDIRDALNAGADKVAINTAALKEPSLIQLAAQRFGSSTIVVGIEAQKINDKYEAYTENGREPTGVDVLTWAKQVVELGAGEIFLTSINQEGTGDGYDTDLIKSIADSVPVPVVACGGAGKREHILRAIVEGHADAVCMASMLHYYYIKNCFIDGDIYAEEGNISFLQSKKTWMHESTSISFIKSFLSEYGIDCRHL